MVAGGLVAEPVCKLSLKLGQFSIFSVRLGVGRARFSQRGQTAVTTIALATISIIPRAGGWAMGNAYCLPWRMRDGIALPIRESTSNDLAHPTARKRYKFILN